MKTILVLALAFFCSSTAFATERPIALAEATGFLRSILAEAKLPKASQKILSASHPMLGPSLAETSSAGKLSFVLYQGDTSDWGTPATALWHGHITQDGKVIFGFRLRRSPVTHAVEMYHFFPFGIPKGLKVNRGFIL